MIGLGLPSSEANRNHRLKEGEQSFDADYSKELLSLDEDHNLCVLMSDIWWRRKYHGKAQASKQDFLTCASLFTNLRYLLRPTVSLYCLDQNWVYFVEIQETDKELYQTKHGNFYNSQFKSAIRLLQVSHEDLLYLAKRLTLQNLYLHGKRKLTHSVTMVTGHLRCGTKLFTRTFESLPDTIIIAQPSSLVNLLNLFSKKDITLQQYRSLLQAAIHLLCKPELIADCYQIENECVRPRQLHIFLCLTQPEINGIGEIKIIYDLFREIKHVFLYRNALTSLRRFERVYNKYWPVSVSDKWSLQLHHHYLNNNNIPMFPYCHLTGEHGKLFMDDEISQKWRMAQQHQHTLLGLCALQWARNCSIYVLLSHEDVPVRGIRYEDLISHCKPLINRLNNDLQLGYSSRDLERAHEELTSQVDHRDLWKQEQRLKPTLPSSSERQEINQIFDCFGLPKLEEATTLSFSILV